MRVLLVKSSSLGDIVHAFPVVNYIKERFSNATIDWVVEAPFASLPAAHPHVNAIHQIDSKKWRRAPFSRSTWQEIALLRKALANRPYDVVFDLQGNIKSSLATWLAASPHKVGFDNSSVSEWPNLLVTNRRYAIPKGRNIRSDYLHLVQTYFGDDLHYEDRGVILQISDDQKKTVADILSLPLLQEKRKILVCSGSAWPNKRLPIETLIRLLRRVQASVNCAYLFAWGNEQEKLDAEELCQALPYSGVIARLPLPALQNLMHGVDLVVAMDSLPLHLAGTTPTPTASFFGPSSAEKYNPGGLRNRTFQGSCPYGRTFEKRCPILRTCATGACLRNQGVDELYKAFEVGIRDCLAPPSQS